MFNPSLSFSFSMSFPLAVCCFHSLELGWPFQPLKLGPSSVLHVHAYTQVCVYGGRRTIISVLSMRVPVNTIDSAVEQKLYLSPRIHQNIVNWFLYNTITLKTSCTVHRSKAVVVFYQMVGKGTPLKAAVTVACPAEVGCYSGTSCL